MFYFLEQLKSQRTPTMANNLVIVESPAKARTITKFLGSDYVVKASMGHIRDLPEHEMGIDVEHDFAPHYEVSADKKKIVNELKKLISKDTQIWIATDEDREGEAIGWHLLHALGIDKKPYSRIVFHEITQNAITDSLKHARLIDINLVNAQQARRVLDRLVGYTISPILWRKIQKGLSAGRVQSVAVRLVVEREREIEKFKTEEYWNIKAFSHHPSKQKTVFPAMLEKIKNKKALVTTAQQAETIIQEAFALTTYQQKENKDKLLSYDYPNSLTTNALKVIETSKKATKRSPAAPFTTSTLQQEASRKLGFNVQQTMRLAQQLYEGVDLPEGRTGLITYMRTDSLNLAAEAIQAINAYIITTYGKEYAVTQARVYKTKSKGAQEAHEAIRPVNIAIRPEDIEAHVDKLQYKLYSLIWKRTVATQMKDAQLENTVIRLQPILNENYLFEAKGQIILFNGFMQVYVEDTDNEDDVESEDILLPDVKEGDLVNLNHVMADQKFTKPPARYTEASLVKKLESEGIGRPSTYAPTITTIMDRKYVEKFEKKYLKPTDIGCVVTDFLMSHFATIMDYHFTANIEEKLDEIAAGNVGWVNTMQEFYSNFAPTVEEVLKTAKKYSEPTDEKCDLCGAIMNIKMSKYGKFLSCSRYPECKNAKPLNGDKSGAPGEKQPPELVDEHCPKCEKQLAKKKGRFGEFLACTGYPECKFTKPIIKEIDATCPQCGSKIVEKRTKRGKMFYGCSAYPKCEFAAWKLEQITGAADEKKE